MATDRLCTAVRNGSGNLEVIAWAIDASGNVIRKGDASAGAVSSLAVGTYGPTTAVTHVRTGSGELKLISWTNLDTGSVARGPDYTAYPISSVASDGATVTAAQGPPPGERIFRVATAVRDGGGNLKIIVWHLVGSSIT